jgi:hypothetical protein
MIVYRYSTTPFAHHAVAPLSDGGYMVTQFNKPDGGCWASPDPQQWIDFAGEWFHYAYLSIITISDDARVLAIRDQDDIDLALMYYPRGVSRLDWESIARDYDVVLVEGYAVNHHVFPEWDVDSAIIINSGVVVHVDNKEKGR